MGASPTTAPAGEPAVPPSPVAPATNAGQPGVDIPPDSATADTRSISERVNAMFREETHEPPGEPELEAAAEPAAREEPAKAANAKPAAKDEPEFADEEPEEKAAADLPDEITFADEEPEESEDKEAATGDKELDDLVAKREEQIASDGKADKDIDDRIRGAFLSKPRGKRMMERDQYGRELESEFGERPTIDSLKETRRQAEAVEMMLDDFHEADEAPGKAQTWLEYWLTPVVEEGRPAELRPGAVTVIRSLPGFLAQNPKTAPLWYREIVPSVAMSVADAFYDMARKSTNDRDKAGMHATAQWLDQHFLGKVRSQAVDEPPKSNANGSAGKPDPETARLIAERDELRQRLGHQETQRFNGFLSNVLAESERQVEADIEHVFKEIRGQVAPRLFKSFTKDLKAEIANDLAGNDDFYRNFERGVRSAHKSGDQGAIDRLSKTYRDKARTYLRKNYVTLKAELVGGASANGSSAASQKVAESEKRHAAHAKVQDRKGPEGGAAAPNIRMAPITERLPGESDKAYIDRQLRA